MKERPIIFNSEMVRAVLEGRKTQTRRIMKNQPVPSKTREGDYWFSCNKMHSMVHVSDFIPGNCLMPDAHEFFSMSCPFGAVGDRLWVRETWQGPLFDEEQLDEFLRDTDPFYTPKYCQYAADGGPKPEYSDRDDNIRYGWRPSIHMPRWASRITLEITGVRVERLASISPDDALAEGYPAERAADGGHLDPWLWFRGLWDGIYPEQSFKANLWVWVIEFKRVEGE